MTRCALAAALAVCCVPTHAADAPGGVLMQAMRDELARSMDTLQMEQMERPYFIAYRVNDIEALQATARFGALTSSSSTRTRSLSVEVRLGSRTLDNTNFMPSRLGGSPATRSILLPLEDDYRELRRQLWLTTDAAYKHALETLAKKRAALKTRSREDVPDFSTESPQASYGELQSEELRTGRVEGLARRLSGVFREMPHVDDSRASTVTRNRTRYYVDSEGSAFVEFRPSVQVLAQARTQAADGMVLQDFETFYADRWHELPDEDAIIERVRAMGASLASRRAADYVERYSGPMLFEGQAAAELLAQALAPRLLAIRVPVAENPNMDGFLTSLRNPFVDKIGARVLPRFLGVTDDPTLGVCADAPMLGGYAVDDNGVPAGPTPLVENGVLKSLLASRNPIAGILRSSGNQRGDFLLPSNLVVAARRGMTAEELHEEFMLLVEERGNDFGVVVRRVANPTLKLDPRDSARSAPAQLNVDRLVRAFKVFPDGREEPIRKVELSTISDANFKEIIAASAASSGHTLPLVLYNSAVLRVTSAFFGVSPAQSVVSVCTPDLLFEELTVRKPPGNVPRPPVAAHPFFD